MKSRTVATASLVLALAACSSSGTLPTLRLSASGSTNDAAKGELASDAPLFVGGSITYEAGTDDWGAAGSAHDTKWPAWSFVAPSTARQVKAGVSRVADALGFTGDLVNNGDKKSWRLDDKASGLTLQSVGDDHTLWWNAWDRSMIDQKEKGIADCPPNAACAPPDWMSPPSTIAAGRLYGREDAEKKATSLLDAMGVDVSADALGWTTTQDPWGTSATAVRLLDGVQTGIMWTFRFGAEGVLESASGGIFDIVKADSYPVIDIRSAIKRLNEGTGFAYGVVATREVSSGPVPATGKQVVKVVSATMSLVQWWMAGGGQMMLPAYDFVLDNGSHVSVVAVTDKYVRFETLPDGDVPAGSTPGTSSGGSSGSSSGSSGMGGGAVEPVPPATAEPVSAEQARTLIGLTLAEAQKVSDGNGWTLRVASMEGKDNLLTTDYQFNRVNVDVLGGKVSAVSVG